MLENLTLIRQNRIAYRGKDREALRQAEWWPFRSLQSKIIYKVQLYNGIAPVRVDPHKTNTTCPVCGHVSRNNRPDNGELVVCQNCGYSERADIVGAVNIASRKLVKDREANLK